jgi:hypothetical protein
MEKNGSQSRGVSTPQAICLSAEDRRNTVFQKHLRPHTGKLSLRYKCSQLSLVSHSKTCWTVSCVTQCLFFCVSCIFILLKSPYTHVCVETGHLVLTNHRHSPCPTETHGDPLSSLFFISNQTVNTNGHRAMHLRRMEM